MLVLRCVHGLSAPPSHQEGIGHEVCVREIHSHSLPFHHFDSDFFKALSIDSLFWRFAGFDVPPDQVPAVWIPAPVGMSMRKKESPATYQRTQCNRVRQRGSLRREP